MIFLMFFSSALTIVFSNPRKIPIVIIVIKEENTPHSPKGSGPYRRDNIGVTITGNRYMRMLLNDILAVFRTKGEFILSLIFSIKAIFFC